MRPIPAAAALATLVASVLMAPAPADAAMTPEPIAVMQGLDKITARVSQFEAPVDQPVTFGTLSIVVRDCEKSAPDERPENAVFVQIYERRPGEKQVRVFSGWMFSSSPALSALEHPVYDVDLLDCKAASGASPEPPPPAPGPAPAPVPAPQSAGRSHGKTAR